MKRNPARCVTRLLISALFCLRGLDMTAADSALPRAVATFHSVGLYWKPLDEQGRAVGSPDNTCSVEFKREGDRVWLRAQPMWLDVNVDVPDASKNPDRELEYRGSILDLQANTSYDIRLTLEKSPYRSVTFIAATWDEKFRIKKTIPLPQGETSVPFVTSEGGSVEEGYVLYESPTDTPTVIDVGRSSPYGMRIAHPWVIVRGATVRGGSEHGVFIDAVHDVVIEGSDISDWGSWMKLPDGSDSKIGWEGQSGIYSQSDLTQRIIIQRNRIHHPHTRSNSWETGYRIGQLGGPANGTRSTRHPNGPNGIMLKGDVSDSYHRGTRGNHVIRYNEIWSTDGVGDVDHPLAGHAFNDGMGNSVGNVDYVGFPGPDSDIYGNYVANCWDDGIEAEGGGVNVRVWGNFMEHVFQGIALAGHSMGPAYVYRNAVGLTRRDPRNPAITHDDISIRSPKTRYPDPGGLFKLGNSRSVGPPPPGFTSGKLNLFHNTSLQPLYQPVAAGQKPRLAGPVWGIGSGGNRLLRRLTSRNNILQVQDAPYTDAAIVLSNDDDTIDLDHDMANTGFSGLTQPHQRNGLRAVPVYEQTAGRVPELAQGSPGRDAALIIENVNSHVFLGDGPDMGAAEAGAPPLVFGVKADWTHWLAETAARQMSAPAPLTGEGLVAVLRKKAPRLFLTPERERAMRDRSGSDENFAAIMARVIRTAEWTLHEPVVEHRLIGPRLLAQSQACLAKVASLAMAYRWTGREVFAERAWRELEAVAAFPDWNPRHLLDTAELCVAYALGYDWLHEWLGESRRAVMRETLVRQGLLPALDVYERVVASRSNNWNPVCNGGFVLASLAIAADDSRWAVQFIDRMLRTLPNALANYGPDGAWYEGPGYWNYGTTFVTLILDGLQTAVGSDAGLSDSVGLNCTGDFLRAAIGTSGQFYNYSDSGADPAPAPALHWLAQRYHRPDLAALQHRLLKDWTTRAQQRRPAEASSPRSNGLEAHDNLSASVIYNHRFYPFEAIWYTPGAGKVTDLSDAFRGVADIAFLRSDPARPTPVFLGMKASGMPDNHAHLDAGSFVLDFGRQRWAVELGREDYNLPEHTRRDEDSARWDYLRLSSRGHNTLTINGQNQRTQSETSLIYFSRGGDRDFAVFDLSDAYREQAVRVERGAAVIAGREVLIQDEVVGLKTGDVVRWAMLTPADVKIEGKWARLYLGGEMVSLEILSPSEVEWRVAPANPPTAAERPNPGISLLSFTAPLTAEEVTTLSVHILPAALVSTTKAEVRPLAAWMRTP